MSYDYMLFKAINSLAGKFTFLDTSMVIIAKYTPLLYGIILLVLWFSGKKAAQRAAFYSVITALIALGLAQIPGMIYFRPRPFADHQVNLLIDRSPDPSFPSDHATGSASLAAGIFAGSKTLGYISWGMCFILSFSRIYVGTHYPLDVLSGIVLGLFTSWLVKRTSCFTLPFIDYSIGRLDKYFQLK